MKIAFRQRLLATTLLVGASMAASPALAQSDPSVPPGPPNNDTQASIQGPANTADVTRLAPADGSTPGEPTAIVVTGSRIPTPNLTSTSPVTVVSGVEAKLQGTTRVEDLLNSLPQVFASQGSTDANGATGIATVDLRDLGSVRTLVLINGRRLGPGDPTTPVADLNFIPSALIKRVDVLTGGASSVYGSDALAGVVNFVLDTNFTGVRFDGQASFYNHKNRADAQIRSALDARNFGYPHGMVNDGGQQNITVSIGADLGGEGRGHVLAYAGYRHVDAITQGDRDFSSCGLSGSLDPNVGVVCTGSSTSAFGRFRQTQQTGTSGGQPIYGATGPSYTTDPNNAGAFRGYVGSRDAFNFNPYNYYQRPDTRYTFGAFGHYEVSPAFDPYIEAMFMDDHTLAQIAPSGAFYGTDFFVNCDNPLLGAAQSTALCGANAGTSTLQSVYIGRRNVEGGPRIDDLRHTDYRIVVGAKGQLARGLTYDAYGQFYRALLSEQYLNDFSRVRLNRALNVVQTPNGPQCASFVNGTDPNCVPYNIFSTGGVTPAAINYLQTPGFRSATNTQYVANASVTATLGEYGIQSPWASDGVGLAAGVEYRRDSLNLQNDAEFLTGDLAGQGTPFGVANARGTTVAKEVFGELRVPLASNRPFFQDLTLEASYRRSKYNLAGSTDAYKLGGDWAPTRDIKFRGSYNRAVRAPNVLELFTPATVQLFSTAGDDPCSGGIDTGTTLVGGATIEQCLNTFNTTNLTTAQRTAILTAGIDPSPAGQYNQRTAGNSALKPETANSITAGVVLTPTFIPGFNASVDYYDIKIKNLISTVGANFAINQCIASGNPFFCNRIFRSADGSLFTGPSFVDNPTQNLGKERTRGFDFNAGYRRSLGFANLTLDFVGTYLRKFEVEPISGANSVGSYDCAGYFGDSCGTPLPKWRHKLRATFAFNRNISVSTAWRHFAGVKNDLDSPNTLIGSGPGTATDAEVTARIKQQNYFDLAISAEVKKMTFRIGAQNIFDRQPPITPGYSNNSSNTYAQVYDALGRYIYASATVDF